MSVRSVKRVKKPRKAIARGPPMMRSGGYSFRSMGGRELNYRDMVLSGLSIPSGGEPGMPGFSAILLNGLTMSTGQGGRVGLKVTVKSIELNIHLTPNLSCLFDFWRVVVAVDKQTNKGLRPAGFQPLFSEVCNTGNSGTVSASSWPFVPRNPEGFKQYKVLLDRLFCHVGLPTSAGGIAAGQNQDHDLRWKKRVNIETQYTGASSGGIGDIMTNGIYLFVIGSATQGNASGQANIVARVRYEDA